MKTKMKRQGSNELPRFAVGALAIAGASAANAATVQISFNNSFISSTLGNQLDTDFGGDSVNDIKGLFGATYAMVKAVGYLIFGYIYMSGKHLAQGNRWVVSGAGGGKAFIYPGQLTFGPVANLSGLIPFNLTDGAVLGGAATAGWLDVTATGRGAGEQGRVDVHRFIFDDAMGGERPTDVDHADAAYPEFGAAVVPEPSGLGLLSLGAGGLLARRRRAMAA